MQPGILTNQSPSRIEDAILRYQKNRRIVTERGQVFMKYLSYGGVSVTQKMFAGVDDREMQNMDGEQVMMHRAQTSIEDERSELPVDFDAVVKGYLYALGLAISHITNCVLEPRTSRTSSTPRPRKWCTWPP